MDAATTTTATAIVRKSFSPELPQFEDFARRAIELGFTVHLTHFRFHPAHTAWAPSCQSGVKLSIIAILDEAKARFGSPDGNFRDVHGDTIASALAGGHLLLDRYESGENLWEDTTPARGKTSRRGQHLRDYWRKKRAEQAAAQTMEPAGSTETPGASADA